MTAHSVRRAQRLAFLQEQRRTRANQALQELESRKRDIEKSSAELTAVFGGDHHSRANFIEMLNRRLASCDRDLAIVTREIECAREECRERHGAAEAAARILAAAQSEAAREMERQRLAEAIDGAVLRNAASSR